MPAASVSVMPRLRGEPVKYQIVDGDADILGGGVACLNLDRVAGKRCGDRELDGGEIGRNEKNGHARDSLDEPAAPIPCRGGQGGACRAAFSRQPSLKAQPVHPPNRGEGRNIFRHFLALRAPSRQPANHHARHRMRPGAGIQLLARAVDMRLHGRGGNAHHAGDLRVRVARADPAQAFELARRQRRDGAAAGRCRSSARARSWAASASIWRWRRAACGRTRLALPSSPTRNNLQGRGSAPKSRQPSRKTPPSPKAHAPPPTGCGRPSLRAR